MNSQEAYYYGAEPVKHQEDPSSRTTSPTVLLHPGLSDCAGSPLAASQSTLSTSSVISSEQYNYSLPGQNHHYMGHPPANGMPGSPMATPGSSTIPVPVRSASWAAGSQQESPSSVPAIITTQNGEGSEMSSASSIPSFKLQQKSSSKPLSAVKKKQSAKKIDKTSSGGKNGETVNARRQKRLERNRESARLSRRRRKQYLEVLEERVTQLSLEMDQGRRAHAAAAIETVLAKRRELLNAAIDPNLVLPTLDGALSRTSRELSVLTTFQMQQLKSFALPAHSKFVLWLTLQGDVYFRGGRAASERLSAARIGERVSCLTQ